MPSINSARLLVFAFFFWVVGQGAAWADVDAAGTWTGSVRCSWGSGGISLIVSPTGSISGTLINAAIKGGRVSGSSVSFSASNFLNTTTFRGTISGNDMRGTYTQQMSGETCNWHASRAGGKPAVAAKDKPAAAKSKVTAASKEKPSAPVAAVAAPAKPVNVPCSGRDRGNASSISGIGGDAAQPAAPAMSSAAPCVQVPGWTKAEPYNHNTEPAEIYLANGGKIIIPGATAGQKWALAAEAGTLLAKLWDGKTTTDNKSSLGDGKGCAITKVFDGYPSPVCEEARQRAEAEHLRASVEQEARQFSKTPEQCRKMGGEIVDPNKDSIEEIDCAKRGGTILLATPEDHGWLPGLQTKWLPKEETRACVFPKNQPEPIRIRDPKLPAQRCRVVDRGAVDIYNVSN